MIYSNGRHIILWEEALKTYDRDEIKLIVNICTFRDRLNYCKTKLKKSIENRDTPEIIRLCDLIQKSASTFSCQGIEYTASELKKAVYKQLRIIEEYEYLLTSIATFEKFIKVHIN